MTDLAALTTNCSYHMDAKKAFHRVAAKYLKRLQKELGDIYGEGSLRHNQGGIAVSGEITLHLEKLYVQVYQSAVRSNNIVMFRECRGLKDYTGGQNNFATADMLMDTYQFARLIQTRCTFTMKRGDPV